MLDFSATTRLVSQRYLVRSALGSGAMGTVHRALDRLTGQEVALKRVQVAPDQLTFHSRHDTTQNPRIALANEFQTLSSLRHPNVINVLDYGFEGGQPYFTMTLLDQPKTLLEATQGQSLEYKVGLLLQVLQALTYIHRRGILHRDLKPSNVLVRHNHVYVLDFGLAIERRGAQAGEAVGTLTYMSPEALMGAPMNEASDLYSFGVMAYELLHGQHPYPSDDVMTILNAILYTEPDLRALDLPEMLVAMIGRLLLKDPAARYPNAEAVIRDLRRVVGLALPESTEVRESFLQAAQFIGREAELGLLTDSLKETLSPSEPKGSAWLIGGESGVGKSRLINELRTRALVEGVLVLHGQAVSESPLPYQLWREALRRLALVVGFDDDSAALLQMVVPDLEILLERQLPPAPSLEPDTLQKRLSLIIEDAFQRAAQRFSILLILEDLQWSGAGLKILSGLVQLAADLPLMIVGNYRHDERPSLPDQLPEMRVLLLERLKDSEIARLSASMLGEAGERPQVVSLLQKETEGNVFFLIEVVRALAEDAGSLSFVGQKTLPSSVMAGGVQRVVQRRLERLPDWARHVVNVMAVAGRQLDLALLEAIDPALAIDEWLTVCVNAAVLDYSDGRWRFAHDKVREGALTSIPADTRPRLHRQVAEAIEAVYESKLDEYVGMLAYHWNAAGDEAKESQYLMRAAWQAYEINEYPQAKALYQRAFDLKIHEREANPQKALADLYFGMGRACYSLSDYDEAREWQQKALTLYQDLNDQLGIADAIGSLGEVEFRQGRFEQALPLTEQSLEIYQQFGEHQKAAYALMNLGVIANRQGHRERALELTHECVEIMRELGEPIALARALNNLGILYDTNGEWDRAGEIYGESLAIRRHINDRGGIAYSLVNLGALRKDQGELIEARRHVEESLFLLRQIGEKLALSTASMMLGEILLELGQLDEAREHYQEALAIRQQIKTHEGTMNSLSLLAELELQAGNPQAAWDYLRQALTLADGREISSQTAGTLKSTALYFMETGDWARAVTIISSIRAWNIGRGLPTKWSDEKLREAERRLSADELAAARAKGDDATPQEIITRLLDEATSNEQ
ncbi:MAG: tetratricopeptide repeat protein [bacterium]|nr:tetratricopeptide repeat protein [bacterium]